VNVADLLSMSEDDAQMLDRKGLSGADGHQHVHRAAESLTALLRHLDRAIWLAWHDDLSINEVN